MLWYKISIRMVAVAVDDLGAQNVTSQQCFRPAVAAPDVDAALGFPQRFFYRR